MDGDWYAGSLSTGDFDGDGHADVCIGAWGAGGNEGDARIVFGK